MPFRVISLKGSEPGFDESVTRANNTQNDLNALDFVSLDPRQELLANELAALGYQYVYKRGSEIESSLNLIEVKEAAIALACACEDIALAVQAKRYVSFLWRDIKTKPYTDVFPETLTGETLVSAVEFMRRIEEVIKDARQGTDKPDDLILTHGDKFIAHCAFRIIGGAASTGVQMTDHDIMRLCYNVVDVYKAEHPQTHPPTVFKNLG